MPRSREDYAEYHESPEELREALAEPPEYICPIGNRPNCKYLHIEHLRPRGIDDDSEYWCEHPALGGGDPDDYCPLNQEEEE